MSHHLIKIALTLVILMPASLSAVEGLYTQQGTDPTWKYIVDNDLIPIERNSSAGIKGSTIDVNQNHPLISSSPYANRPIQNNVAVHTLGNPTVSRSNFPKWSRWYQEDGNTQIFRLFKDEINVRNRIWYKPRSEAELRDHVTGSTVKNGADFAEWSGTYTVTAPILCTIFQIWGSSGDDIPLMLHIRNGKLMYNPRTSGWREMLPDVVGTSFDIKVRDYGNKYEVFLNGEFYASRNYTRTGGNVGGHFRWGCYHSGDAVVQDFKMFVTGAQRRYSNELLPEPASTYGNGGTPGTGDAWPITRAATTRIEAENYDQGDADRVYSDDSGGNIGGEYRSDNVDIGAFSDSGDGYNVGWARAGEWLQYTIDVERAGLYDVTIRHARSPEGSSALRLSSQGNNLTGNIEAPSTGAWDGYSTITESVELSEGEQAIRLHFIDGSINVDWLEITAAAAPVITMVDLGSTKSWDIGTSWSDGQAAHSGADYVVPAGGNLTSPRTNASFPGYSLTVEKGGKVQVRSTEAENEVITVESLTFSGGNSYQDGEFAELSAGTGSNQTNVLNGILTNSGHTRILTFDRISSGSLNRSLKILSQIKGDGRLQAWEGQGGQGGDTLTLTNASNTFAGTWETGAGSKLVFTNAGAVGDASITVLSTGQLEIQDNWTTNGTLNVADANDTEVDFDDHVWSVANLSLGGSTVPDGTYTAAELNTLSSNTIFTGSGGIRVGSGGSGGPIAYWNFNEASGAIANDLTGNGYHGTINGATWASDNTRSSYLSFDGNNDRVETLFQTDLTSALKDFTWALWVNNQANSSNGVIVGNRYPSIDGELNFCKLTSSQLDTRLSGSSHDLDFDDMARNGWHHHSVTKSGATLLYYRDGTLIDSRSITSYADGTYPFFIGGDPAGGSGEHFQGFIDDVKLYDRALSLAEITALMTTSDTSREDDWRMRYFGTTATSGIAASDYDANLDGESNLMEFATHQDPRAQTLAVTPVEVNDTNTSILFRYTRSKAAMADGLTFRVKWSDNLREDSWSSAGVIESVELEDSATQQMIVEIPMSPSGSRFMHLEINR